VKHLKLSLIRTDGGTQMRASIDKDVYFEYRDIWKNGGKFDPIDVFYDGAEYWLADGFHRFYGAREAQLEKIEANVHQGTQRDAILFAAGANSRHGMRRTNADKRRSVEALLSDDEWVKWTDTKIAASALVSINFVGVVRKQLSSDESSPAARTAGEPRVGRDGRSRKSRAKAVSGYFDQKTTGEAEGGNGRPAVKSGKAAASPASAIDDQLKMYVSPLTRGLADVAKLNGGMGPIYENCKNCLDDLIVNMKLMREGKQ
jgi:hypothetical protein